jgi:hypothetical protein
VDAALKTTLAFFQLLFNPVIDKILAISGLSFANGMPINKCL